MNKNEKEKQMLYEWGLKNHSKYLFQTIDQERSSYFIKRESKENSYIREYGFETLPELIKELDILWESDKVMEEIKKVIAIAAIKNKPFGSISKETDINRKGKQEEKDKLPVYIYNF